MTPEIALIKEPALHFFGSGLPLPRNRKPSLRKPLRPSESTPTRGAASDIDLNKQPEEIAKRVAATYNATPVRKNSADLNLDKLHVDLRAAASQIVLRRQSLDSRETQRVSSATNPTLGIGYTEHSNREFALSLATLGRSATDAQALKLTARRTRRVTLIEETNGPPPAPTLLGRSPRASSRNWRILAKSWIVVFALASSRPCGKPSRL